MKDSYKACLSRSLHSVFARIRWVRWVSQVVAREAPAPTNEPSVAAIAATIVIGWTGDSAGRAVAHSRQSASYPGLTQPAAVTGAEQARVLRYWTAARMAAA